MVRRSAEKSTYLARRRGGGTTARARCRRSYPQPVARHFPPKNVARQLSNRRTACVVPPWLRSAVSDALKGPCLLARAAPYACRDTLPMLCWSGLFHPDEGQSFTYSHWLFRLNPFPALQLVASNRIMAKRHLLYAHKVTDS